MKKRNTISFQIAIHEIKPTDIFKFCHIYEKQEKLEAAQKAQSKMQSNPPLCSFNRIM